MRLIPTTCKECGEKYNYQASGAGCSRADNNKVFCPECLRTAGAQLPGGIAIGVGNIKGITRLELRRDEIPDPEGEPVSIAIRLLIGDVVVGVLDTAKQGDFREFPARIMFSMKALRGEGYDPHALFPLAATLVISRGEEGLQKTEVIVSSGGSGFTFDGSDVLIAENARIESLDRRYFFPTLRRDKPGEGMYEVSEQTIEPYPQIETIFSRQAGIKPTCKCGIEGCFCLTGFPYEKQCKDCRDIEGRDQFSHCVCGPASESPFTAGVDPGDGPSQSRVSFYKDGVLVGVGNPEAIKKLELTTMSHLETYVKNACRTEAVPLLTHEDFVAQSLPDIEEPQLHALVGTQKVRLLHSAIGMASEIGEYLDACSKTDDVNVLEELGDMMWYWAIAIDTLGLNPARVAQMGRMMGAPLSQIPRTAQEVEGDLFEGIGDWCDVAKKHAFYGKALNLDTVTALLAIIYRAIDDLHVLRKVHSLEETLRRNILKLRLRYPEKYSDEQALNRDLGAERAVLEGTDE